MTFYYVDPHPEHFVEQVRQLSARGDLTSERSFVAVTFLSCVLAENPSEARGWLDALADLPPDDLRAVETAVWLSGTPEGKACLAGSAWTNLFAQLPPDILAMTIDDPGMLDALWAYYFATGNVRAVRRIISVLEYMSDLGAAKSFRDSPQTADDKARALRDGMFQAASWSLGTLMREHPTVRAFCGDLVRSGEGTPKRTMRARNHPGEGRPEHLEREHRTRGAAACPSPGPIRLQRQGSPVLDGH